jgi:hypothetical protein
MYVAPATMTRLIVADIAVMNGDEAGINKADASTVSAIAATPVSISITSVPGSVAQ